MDMLEFSQPLMAHVKLDFGKMIFHGVNSANITQRENKSSLKDSTKNMVMLVEEPRSLLQTIKAKLQGLTEFKKLWILKNK